jgi:hypothetical protein
MFHLLIQFFKKRALGNFHVRKECSGTVDTTVAFLFERLFSISAEEQVIISPYV